MSTEFEFSFYIRYSNFCHRINSSKNKQMFFYFFFFIFYIYFFIIPCIRYVYHLSPFGIDKTTWTNIIDVFCAKLLNVNFIQIWVKK